MLGYFYEHLWRKLKICFKSDKECLTLYMKTKTHFFVDGDINSP